MRSFDTDQRIFFVSEVNAIATDLTQRCRINEANMALHQFSERKVRLVFDVVSQQLSIRFHPFNN